MKNGLRVGIMAMSRQEGIPGKWPVRMAKQLLKNGLHPVVICTDHSEASDYAHENKLEVILLRPFKKSYDFAGALSFRRKMKRAKIKLLVFCDYRDTAVLVTAKFLMKGRLKLVFLQWEGLSIMKRDFLHTFRFNQLDAWVSPYPSTSLEVKGETNLDHRHLHVFPIPYAGSPRKGILTKRKGRKREPMSIAHIVHPRSIADTLALIESCGVLSGRSIDFNLRLVARDAQWLNSADAMLLRQAIAKHSFGDRVTLRVLNRSIYGFLGKCSVAFLSMQEEPFAGCALRAMHLEVPIVTFHGLLSNEMFKEGETALLCGREDHQGLADSLYALHINEAYSNDLAAKAMKLAKSEYSMKAFALHLSKLIKATARA